MKPLRSTPLIAVALLAASCGKHQPQQPPPPPAQASICTAPIAPADVSHPTTTVGTGPGSCTEQAFAAAVAQGGVITFNCGGAATITLTSQKELPVDRDTVIDGGGQITLDGGGQTRLLNFGSICQGATTATVTLQHVSLRGGKAVGQPIPPLPGGAPAYCSQGFFNDGGGGAIRVRGGALHVIDAVFSGNAGSPSGPDVGGGAIYAIGSPDLTIVGSRFEGNSAANGGAVASLNSILTLVNDTFTQNQATGAGANADDASCPTIRPPWACGFAQPETGSGGDGGAVAIDGGLDNAVTICGSTFSGNSAGALGGAIFRTVDSAARKPMTIDRCAFDGNTTADGDPASPRFNAEIGGGAIYCYRTDLSVTASTFSNNASGTAGALLPFGTLNATNVTFSGNRATRGPGGAIRMFGQATLLNCTFAGNRVDLVPSQAGPGLPPQGAALAGGTYAADNSLFSNNTTQDGSLPMTCAQSASGANDIQWPASHAVGSQPDAACASGIHFADPLLGSLRDNGGPTATLLPQTGSPAIGAGQNCPAFDQRGVARKAAGCTAGAVEPP